ncbi:GntR family transcriptional regulator [Cytobacillus oceanisediminis]|uniref:HTH gntR-type domain-containing protein n=1 Tax=Cytobacillus oceanisediminis 2691 TaxID=1196031 RepID=A0A169G0B1_9BACI|nr:GntR family transcriptional regulator [Cytobacillus oceanisediminis]AND42375.1 hypothetical protein A361_25555 [Cytobacillus oceanisediminis 2691]MCM3245053.1 GntR family transcriptional regulator [Cytobacillus oceanisediminis]MCS0827231.1 GntR family transcriptional regulator [Cytobacillus firmus]
MKKTSISILEGKLFNINLNTNAPLYKNISEDIKGKIINNFFLPGEKLPSIRSLASHIGINPNTIQKAYKDLEDQGYLISIKGKGNFVLLVPEAIGNNRKCFIKRELKKMVLEALYLGMTLEEIKAFVNENISKK